MILFVNVNGDQGNSWAYFGTTRTADIRSRPQLNSLGFTKSVDLFGRPVSSAATSQIRIDLNDEQKAVRRHFGR